MDEAKEITGYLIGRAIIWTAYAVAAVGIYKLLITLRASSIGQDALAWLNTPW